MILPNCNSKDPEVNKMFQLVDEKLSELYSVHGTVELRGDMRLQKPPSNPTTTRDMNNNSLARAWLFYDGVNHEILNSYNIAKVEQGPIAGSYYVSISVRPNTDDPVVIVNANVGGALSASALVAVDGSLMTIAIQTSTFAGAPTDSYVYMVMYGD
jgi:hypothetical protein